MGLNPAGVTEIPQVLEEVTCGFFCFSILSFVRSCGGYVRAMDVESRAMYELEKKGGC